MPGLGRIPNAPDPRDNNFLARAVAPPRAETALRPFIHYPTFYPPLDQGQTSWCVEMTMRSLALSSPNRWRSITAVPYGQPYAWMQEHDEFPGNESTGLFGTSGRAGAEWLLKVFGSIESYQHIRSLEEALAWMSDGHGPIACGFSWYDSFYDAPMKEHNYRFTIVPGAKVVGGHEFMLPGYNLKRREFDMQQSWGRDAYLRGRAYLPFDVFNVLLEDFGDVIGVIEKKP